MKTDGVSEVAESLLAANPDNEDKAKCSVKVAKKSVDQFLRELNPFFVSLPSLVKGVKAWTYKLLNIMMIYITCYI